MAGWSDPDGVRLSVDSTPIVDCRGLDPERLERLAYELQQEPSIVATVREVIRVSRP